MLGSSCRAALNESFLVLRRNTFELISSSISAALLTFDSITAALLLISWHIRFSTRVQRRHLLAAFLSYYRGVIFEYLGGFRVHRLLTFIVAKDHMLPWTLLLLLLKLLLKEHTVVVADTLRYGQDRVGKLGIVKVSMRGGGKWKILSIRDGAQIYCCSILLGGFQDAIKFFLAFFGT